MLVMPYRMCQPCITHAWIPTKHVICAGGVEGYFVPPSDLAERLIKTAYLAEGRHLQREADDGLPEELGSDQLLLLLVHLKVAHCSFEFQQIAKIPC